MNCEQMNELMSAWLDGELSPEQEEAMQAHLEHCPVCRAVFEQLQGLHTSFSDLEEPAPDGFAQRVMERVARESKPKIVPFPRRWRSVGTLAACALLVVGLGVGRLSFSGGSSEPMAAALPETAMDAQAEGEWFSFARTEEKSLMPDSPAAAAPEMMAPTAPEPEAPAPAPDTAPAETVGGMNTVEKQESVPGLWEITLLQEMPEDLEEVLGPLTWQEREEDMALCAPLTREQGERLLELAEDRGLSLHLYTPEDRTGEGWLLVWLPE